ncbi:MAG TPA: ECF-type sigma factor [Bryobacteraceae bacterium]|nr:ECF-type sigma factor [Bryobacteraceae bacterium]
MNTTVPGLFEKLRRENPAGLNELTPALYQQLHRIAARHLRGERSDHTLQATALVHEAYLKLTDRQANNFTGEEHFLAIASRVMRQVLVDYARSRASQKRAGGEKHIQFETEGENGKELLDLMQLDNALQALGEEDEGMARLVEMRYFGGMTAEETAEALGLSVHAVRHDLRFAKAWLRRKLTE